MFPPSALNSLTSGSTVAKENSCRCTKRCCTLRGTSTPVKYAMSSAACSYETFALTRRQQISKYGLSCVCDRTSNCCACWLVSGNSPRMLLSCRWYPAVVPVVVAIKKLPLVASHDAASGCAPLARFQLGFLILLVVCRHTESWQLLVCVLEALFLALGSCLAVLSLRSPLLIIAYSKNWDAPAT